MAWHGKSLQMAEWSWIVPWPGFAALHHAWWACPATRAVSRPMAQEEELGNPGRTLSCSMTGDLGPWHDLYLLKHLE